jgi:hypothetical protein
MHRHIRRCPICLREDVPGEFHHVASQRQHPTWGWMVCLNCHAVLTKRHMTNWHPSWMSEQHPVRCLFQGLFDMFWLWLQRSHSAWSSGQLAKLAVQGRWVLLGRFGLVGWEGWQAA